MTIPKTIEIIEETPHLIDQTLLPNTLKIIPISTIKDMFNAIKFMQVRGAPAIGIAAASGIALAITHDLKGNTVSVSELQKAKLYLDTARPTAVNLSWGTQQVIDFAKKESCLKTLKNTIWNFIKKLADQDEACNRQLGIIGADAINNPVNILTHCNAGSLATVYWGTALGVIRELHNRNNVKHVYIDETRPRFQGGKLTAWELGEDNIPSTIITDNMAGHLMANNKIDAIIVGADRITKNGDVANKIGTYSVAVLAHYHKIPFYVAAPKSTIDRHTESGKEIIIENRDPSELSIINNEHIYPKQHHCINPAFDITPAPLITGGIITEESLWKNTDSQTLLEKNNQLVPNY